MSGSEESSSRRDFLLKMIAMVPCSSIAACTPLSALKTFPAQAYSPGYFTRDAVIEKIQKAAIDFVRDAFGHLKAIAVDKGGQALLKIANVGRDAGVLDTNDKDALIAAAKRRQWDREKSVRTLA